LRTTTADIRSLIDRVDRGEIRLPEIQRNYVWKPPKVAALVDSLYRRYPTGSLLLWETGEEIIERAPSIQGPNENPLNKPQYLIDGQQRLTSLHRVFKGHEGARIVFNVETERFQNESAATSRDARWISVHELLNDGEDIYTLVGRLRQRLPQIEPKDLSDRIDRVRKISDYSYHVEILDDLPYDEVTDIFVRVNSRGVPLRSVDLALATLSARWPGVISKLEDESQTWAAAGYPAISIAFLARALAALTTEAGGFLGFANAPIQGLEEGWKLTRRGVSHLVPLLKNNAGIATSELLPAANALVPVVVFLGSRPDVALPENDANALIYWLFGAFIQGRYSGSVETVLAQDLGAIRSREPLLGLFRNLRLFGQRLVVTEDALAGRTERSPYFLLSYLAARRAGAKDWWHAVDICTSSDGHFKLEYHHVHPRATLKAKYSKNEINDLANLAFISAKANRKISDRPPATYFPEIGDAQLAGHLVPTDEALRTPAAYPDFVRARRRLLAQAMTSLLDSFAPSDLAGTSITKDPASGEQLTFAAFGESPKDPHAILLIHSVAAAGEWRTQLPLRDFALFLSDLENGYSAAIPVDGELAQVDAGVDEIDLPLGPLLARGALDEWRGVLDREYAEIAARDDCPSVQLSPPWIGGRTPFPVADSQ
jgi:hypothetical protein